MTYSKIQTKLREIMNLPTQESQVTAQITLLSNCCLESYELQCLLFEQLLHSEVFIRYMPVTQ